MAPCQLRQNFGAYSAWIPDGGRFHRTKPDIQVVAVAEAWPDGRQGERAIGVGDECAALQLRVRCRAGRFSGRTDELVQRASTVLLEAALTLVITTLKGVDPWYLTGRPVRPIVVRSRFGGGDPMQLCDDRRLWCESHAREASWSSWLATRTQAFMAQCLHLSRIRAAARGFRRVTPAADHHSPYTRARWRGRQAPELRGTSALRCRPLVVFSYIAHNAVGQLPPSYDLLLLALPLGTLMGVLNPFLSSTAERASPRWMKQVEHDPTVAGMALWQWRGLELFAGGTTRHAP